MAAMAATPMPAPIPAIAPVDNPLSESAESFVLLGFAEPFVPVALAPPVVDCAPGKRAVLEMLPPEVVCEEPDEVEEVPKRERSRSWNSMLTGWPHIVSGPVTSTRLELSRFETVVVPLNSEMQPMKSTEESEKKFIVE
jgi:hypothetical protein